MPWTAHRMIELCVTVLIILSFIKTAVLACSNLRVIKVSVLAIKVKIFYNIKNC